MISKTSMQRRNRSDYAGHNSTANFYKIIFPSIIQDHKLRIPEKFVETYGDELSNVATLIVPNGRNWHVGLEKAEEMLWFHDGWQDFMEYHSIRCGYFLVFKYQGNSSFNVLIFDLTASEIRYPCNTLSSFEQPNQCKQCPVPSDKEEMKDDDSVEILGSSQESLKLRRCYITRSKRYRMEDQSGIINAENTSISCEGKLKKIEMSNSHRSFLDKTKKYNWDLTKAADKLRAPDPSGQDNCLQFGASKLNDCVNHKTGEEDPHPMKGADDVQMETRSRNPKGHLFSETEHIKTADREESLIKHGEEAEMLGSNTCPKIFLTTKTMTTEERERATHAARMFKPENPSFVVVLRQYNVCKHHILYVPREFAENYLHGVSDFIELEVSDGRKWSVHCVWQFGKVSYLSRGWATFVRENFLDVGDVCVFELIQVKDVVLRVSKCQYIAPLKNA